MRKVFLTLVILFLYQICTAPKPDLRLRMSRYKIAAKYAAKIYHESELERFIKDLGYKESGNNWLSINRIGCFGEWQFSESTLRYLGYRKITLRRFRTNPEIFPREMQKKVLRALIRVNRVLLLDYEHYIDDTIQGVRITRAGMIAASHLGGAGSLKKFLDSGGKINRKDVLGTSIYDYLRIFNNYELE